MNICCADSIGFRLQPNTSAPSVHACTSAATSTSCKFRRDPSCAGFRYSPSKSPRVTVGHAFAAKLRAQRVNSQRLRVTQHRESSPSQPLRGCIGGGCSAAQSTCATCFRPLCNLQQPPSPIYGWQQKKLGESIASWQAQRHRIAACAPRQVTGRRAASPGNRLDVQEAHPGAPTCPQEPLIGEVRRGELRPARSGNLGGDLGRSGYPLEGQEQRRRVGAGCLRRRTKSGMPLSEMQFQLERFDSMQSRLIILKFQWQ